jgi:hypothetical protein
MTRPSDQLLQNFLSKPADDVRETGLGESLEAIIVRMAQRPSIATSGPGESVPTTLLVWQRLKRNGWNRR